MPQPHPPPESDSMLPSLSLANAANTDKALWALALQVGHGDDGSRDVAIGLILSNLFKHVVHVYSCIGFTRLSIKTSTLFP